jgi:hypothetical protein
MGVRKQQAPRRGSAGNQVGIPELHRRCLDAEPNLTKEGMDKLKLILAKGLFFDRPRLDLPQAADEFSATDEETDIKIRTEAWEAFKYRTILDLLRKQTKREDRLFWLAWWLHQEEVCEPEDILGIKELRRRAKKAFHFLSHSDFYHAERVRKCLPYFEKLLADCVAHKNNIAKLVKLGYDEVAIKSASKKKSAIPTACEWLATLRDSVSNVDALTLQNAYSRVYGPKHRSVHKSRTSH